MELCKFKGVLYGKLDKQLFVWESEWDSFRPIEKIAWDGSKIITTDLFRKDIFHPLYGFGSAEMKELCKTLTETTELGIPESKWLPWMDEEWFRDRRCTFAYPCTPKNTNSWAKYVKYINSNPKTLRRHVECRKTKRLVPR